MKKAIMIALALVGISSFALEQNVFWNGLTTRMRHPQKIKSIAVTNPGGKFGSRETVTLYASENMEYNRQYLNIDKERIDSTNITVNTGFGTGNVGEYTRIPDAIGFNIPYDYNRDPHEGSVITNLGCVAYRTSYSDRVSYEGEIEHHLTNGVIIQCKMSAKFDPNTWKIILTTTNDYSMTYVFTKEFNNTEFPCGQFSYTSWTGTQRTCRMYPVLADGRTVEVNNDPWYIGGTCVSPVVTQKLANAYITVPWKEKKAILTFNAGTEPCAITNCIDVIIPGGVDYSISAQNDNTKVKVIYE